LMADKENDEKTFKVDDRRTSSGEIGDDNQPAGVDEKPETEVTGETGGGDSHDSKTPPSGGEGGATQVDFSTFIFSLFSSGLIQLGDMADPITGQMEKNLLAAKQTIDILDIMTRKTEGNLSEEEDRLIKNASAELKWKYLDAIKEER